MVIKKEQFFPYPIEMIWKALTDADSLSRWLKPTNFEAELGRSFYFHSGDRANITDEILKIIPLGKLVYSWKREGLPSATTVTWTLKAMQEGSLLKLEHDGFGDDSLALFDAHHAGWDKKLANLGKLLTT